MSRARWEHPAAPGPPPSSGVGQYSPATAIADLQSVTPSVPHPMSFCRAFAPCGNEGAGIVVAAGAHPDAQACTPARQPRAAAVVPLINDAAAPRMHAVGRVPPADRHGARAVPSARLMVRPFDARPSAGSAPAGRQYYRVLRAAGRSASAGAAVHGLQALLGKRVAVRTGACYAQYAKTTAGDAFLVVRACVCVRACACVRVRACACVCVSVHACARACV